MSGAGAYYCIMDLTKEAHQKQELDGQPIEDDKTPGTEENSGGH